ncbi:MAG: hypothetical protein NZ528_05685, partial [Caldilineales bacterium]|nr:hypothetical protein [Caldilineales bacterium]
MCPGNKPSRSLLSLGLVVALLVTSLLPVASLAAPTRTTPAAADSALLVTFPGNYAEVAGLGNNWDPGNLNTQGNDANGDGVYKFVTDAIPPGTYEFKVTVGGSWSENYGRNGVPGGPNVSFT